MIALNLPYRLTLKKATYDIILSDVNAVQLIHELNYSHCFELSLSLSGASICFDLGYKDWAEHDIIGLKDPAHIIDEGAEPGVLRYLVLHYHLLKIESYEILTLAVECETSET